LRALADEQLPPPVVHHWLWTPDPQRQGPLQRTQNRYFNNIPNMTWSLLARFRRLAPGWNPFTMCSAFRGSVRLCPCSCMYSLLAIACLALDIWTSAVGCCASYCHWFLFCSCIPFCYGTHLHVRLHRVHSLAVVLFLYALASFFILNILRLNEFN
jgi:hypothetical protein